MEGGIALKPSVIELTCPVRKPQPLFVHSAAAMGLRAVVRRSLSGTIRQRKHIRRGSFRILAAAQQIADLIEAEQDITTEARHLAQNGLTFVLTL